MSINELQHNLKVFSSIHNVHIDLCESIPKSELEIGKEYQGECRNSGVAIWNGTQFEYTRYKWGSYYKETINHYEDDDGYDVFVPIKIKSSN